MKFKRKRSMAKVATVAAAITMAASFSASILIASANIADNLDVNKKYTSDYSSLEEVLEAGAAHNLKLAEEGYVLLKNKDKALPLTAGSRRVTVLGATSDSIATTGAGSGAQSRPSLSTSTATAAQLFNGFEDAGIEVNPAMRAAYATNTMAPQSFRIQGAGFSSVTQYYDGHHYMNKVDEATDSSVAFGGGYYVSANDSDLAGLNVTVDGESVNAESMNAEYDDAALVVITRNGTEGSDNPAYNVPGHNDTTDHFLMLTDGEKELMAYAIKNFDKVVVILNSPSVMELGELENNDGISAIINIGLPGWNGADAVGKLLTGEVNPSARTVDIYMDDLKKDPAWFNFGNYQHITEDGTVSGDAMPMGHAGIATGDENFIDYAEGIYMGYRYYETVAADLGNSGEEWYSDNVVYPFGHGLSYTTFNQEIKSVSGNFTEANKNGKITVTVTVTNTGDVAGKEVVQLYSTAPYTEDGIEKSAKDLVGFTKTKLLDPGESQDVTVEINVKDFASFDYNDANANGHNGYELEDGNYTLTLGKNSHEAFDTHSFSVSDTINWDEDDDDDTPNNIYSQPADSKWGEFNTMANTWTADGTNNYLSRTDLVYRGELDWENIEEKLTWATTSQNSFTDTAFNILNTRHLGHPYEDYDDNKTEEVETDYENLWVKTESDIPSTWTQAPTDSSSSRVADIQLIEMVGLSYEDAKWDNFLNQLTWAEMVTVVSNGNFQIPAIAAVGLPRMRDSDGPIQLKSSSQNGWAWVSATVVASTWNTELAEEQGNLVGEESMWLNSNGWYGPAMNTHRNPLAGRNFEYYSQDGLQGGKIAAAVVKGATDKGCHVYIKHFFMNDQETGREGLVTFATEQAIREIYAKPFEFAVREGNANGVMNSFNLIGISTSVNYAVVEQMLYNEWGFDGFSVTDYWVTDYAYSCGWTGYSMIRGLTAPLAGFGANTGATYRIEGNWDADARDGMGMVTAPNGPSTTAEGYDANAATPTQWYYTRETVHRLMYTVANSNGLMRVGFTAADLIDGDATAALETNVNEAITPFTVINEDADVSAYNVTVTGLPEGLTFDSETYTVSGTPTERGVFTATISIDGGVLGTVTATKQITVYPLVALNDTVNGYGIYDIQITQYVAKQGVNYFPGQSASANTYNNGNGYLGITYSATGLPNGLTIDAQTGVISGEVLTGGTYNITVTATLIHVTRGSWYGYVYYGTENIAYSTEVEWTVDGNFAVRLDMNYPNGEDRYITVSDDGGITLSALTAGINPVNPYGYDFLGWSTSVYKDDIITDTDLNITEGTVLYAIYDIPPIAIIEGEWYIDGVATGVPATGVGIDTAVVNEDGHLIITLTDGTELDLGDITGRPGDDGEDGETGATGVGIKSIEKISSEGLVDTYRITMTDDTYVDFTVTNGADGADGNHGSDGANGADGSDGADGLHGTSGGSSAAGIAGAVLGGLALGLVLVGGVLYFIKRKKD